MKKIVLILDFLFSISFIVNAQWVHGNNIAGNSNTYFLSVDFVNYQHGWISGDNGVIFHTTDSGLTWIQQNSNTTKHLRKIRFSDINNGWAVGDSGVIIHTFDGGNTWILQPNTFNYLLFDIAAIDSEYCWITGYNGLVLKTTDGGTSWNSEHSISGPWVLSSVQFLNRSIGWVTSYYFVTMGYGSSIRKTTNGGQNWIEQLNYPQNHSIVRDVNFVDESVGWAVGDNFSQFRTNNGGSNWYEWTLLYNRWIRYAFIKNVSVGWMVEDEFSYNRSNILFTNDGGINLSTQYQTYQKVIQDFCIVNQRFGWAVGQNGLILKTVNGGGVFPSTPLLIAPENNQQLISDTVNLVWSSATPQITGYELFLSSDSLFLNTIDTLITDTTIILANLEINTKYYWKVKAKNEIGWGDESQVSTFTTILTDVEETKVLPFEFALSQNYPNPFNPITSIQYAIGSRQFVTLKVYNVLGKEVATLVNEEKPSGSYEVDFKVGASQRLALTSSVYFYQLKAGDYIETKKMVLMK